MKSTNSELVQQLESSKERVADYLKQFEQFSNHWSKSAEIEHVQKTLEIVSSFDVQNIKNMYGELKDKNITRLAQSIADQIARYEEDKLKYQELMTQKIEKNCQSNTSSKSEIVQPNQQTKEPNKKLNQKSLLSGVFGMFKIQKKEKPKEMILPQNQKKPVFDQATRTWIFEGDEPPVIKQIPKPPSQSKKKTDSEQPKKPANELDNLIAPPSFKRKSTATKSKGKEAVEASTVPHLEPFNLLMLKEKITIEYESLSSIAIKSSVNSSQIKSSHEMDQIFECMQSFLNQFQEKNQINSLVSFTKEVDQKHLELIQRITHHSYTTSTLYQNVLQRIEQKSKPQYNQQPTQKVIHLQTTLDQLNNHIASLEERLKQKDVKIAQMHQKIISVSEEKQTVEKQRYFLSEKLQYSEKHLQKLNDLISKEKTQIETNLKVYDEREKSYLKLMRSNQDHQSLVQSFQEALKKESLLYQSITQKRIAVCMNYDSRPSTQKAFEDEEAKEATIFALSEIISSMTEAHLSRLDSFNKNYNSLHRKYQETKQLIHKIKSQTANQNVSLNRSVSRLKSLVETYKNSKEEAEERAFHYELEYEKLKKRLQHYKQEEELSRSYISRLRKSQGNQQNQSIVSLHQDNEQLAQKIDEMEKEIIEKNVSIQEIQSNLEQLLVDYEKNQLKLITAENALANANKSLREIKYENEDYKKKVQLYEMKLTHSKEKIEEHKIREEQKIKNIQSLSQKRLSLMQTQVQEWKRRFQALNQRAQQQKQDREHNLKVALSSYAVREVEYKNLLAQKQHEHNEMLFLIDELNNKKEQLQNQNNKIIEQLRHHSDLLFSLEEDYKRSSQQQAKQVEKLRGQSDSLNSTIDILRKRYVEYEHEQLLNQQDIQKKFSLLFCQIQSSNSKSQFLINQLDQYKHLIDSITKQLANTESLLIQEKNQLNATVFYYQTEFQKVLNDLAGQKKIRSQTEEMVLLLEEKLEATMSQNQHLLSQVKSQRNQVQQKNHQISELEKGILKAKLQFQSVKEHIEKQKDEPSYQLLLDEQTNLKKRIQELNAQISKQQQQKEELQEMSQALSVEVEEKDLLIENLKKQIGDLGQENKQKISQLEQVKNQIIRLSQEAKQMRKTFDKDLQTQIASTIHTYEFQLIEQQNKVRELEFLLQKINQEKQKIEEIALGRKQQIENQQKFLKQERAKLQSLVQVTERQQQHRDAIAAYTDEIEKLKVQLVQERNGKLEIQEAIMKMSEQIQQRNTQIKELKFQNQDLELKHSNTLAQLNQLRKQSQAQKLNEKENITQNIFEKEIVSVQNLLQKRNEEVLELKAKLKDLSTTFKERQCDYEKKIEKLETDSMGVGTLKSNLKKLEQSLKNVQYENTLLLKQKVELMKSNDHLMAMNQKLVAEISPHSLKEIQKKVGSVQTKPKVQQKEEVKEQKEEKTEPKGLLGSFASLFLTPSEAKRLAK